MNSRISALEQKSAVALALKRTLQKGKRRHEKHVKKCTKRKKDLKNSDLVLEYLINRNYDGVIELFEGHCYCGAARIV